MAFLASFALPSCFAYKVVPEDASRPFAAHTEFTISKIKSKYHPHPEGLHCFEPMLYVLTAGIIPAHCVEKYSVSANGATGRGEAAPVTVKVTGVGGWIALLLVPLPNWRYGPIPDPGPKLDKIIMRSVMESE